MIIFFVNLAAWTVSVLYATWCCIAHCNYIVHDFFFIDEVTESRVVADDGSLSPEGNVLGIYFIVP